MKKEEEEKLSPSLDDFKMLIKQGVTDPHPYNRLMIAYRRNGEFKQELQVIKRAIAVFQAQLKKLQQEAWKGNRKLPRIKALSNAISKITGLSDKKGKTMHTPEPIARWIKRQATVEQKIKTATTKGNK